VICAGRGIPTVDDDQRQLHRVEAVIDKDLALGALTEQVAAHLLMIATDVDGVYRDTIADAVRGVPGVGTRVVAAARVAGATSGG